MPIGTVTIAWEIRHPITQAAATGRVRVHVPRVLLASTENVIYGPGPSEWVDLDAQGRGSLAIPDPHDTGITPQAWAPIVEVASSVWNAKYPVAIPTGAAGTTVQLADLSPVVDEIEGTAYALVGALKDYLPKTGGIITGPISWDGPPTDPDHLTPKSYVDAAIEDVVGSGGGVGSLPLFNVEDYGAAGDGTTDDYEAIREAWDDMLASPVGGLLYFPRAVTYRIDADLPGRLTVSEDDARALFPLPMRSRQLTKLTYGILGVGEAYTVRTADLGGTPGQVQTASVLLVDYSTPFAWTAAGLPAVFGTPDADVVDPEGNTFSNLHFFWDNLIIRQPDNPSMTDVNIELASTHRIGYVRVDCVPVLDLVSEPTHPTALGVVLPRSNNNVAQTIGGIVVEGRFGGFSLCEHGNAAAVLLLRCKVGLFTRRINSHYSRIGQIKLEQCPWGFAGIDPSAAVEEAIVGVHGWTGRIDFLDIEDYAYNGATPWIYAPTAGAHINDPDGVLRGTIAFCGRINSEPPSPAGIGIGPGGGSASLYVIGPSGTNSPIAIYGFDHTAAATRLLPPSGPSFDEFRLFATEPAGAPGSSVSEGSALTIGVRVDITEACSLTHLHFWRADTAITGTITGRVHRMSDEAVVAGPVTFTLSGTGWQTAELPDPVDLEDGERYIFDITTPDRYSFTGAYFDSGLGAGGIISGPLTAFSTNDSPGGQGAFASGTTYPSGNGNGANYWVDGTVRVAA